MRKLLFIEADHVFRRFPAFSSVRVATVLLTCIMSFSLASGAAPAMDWEFKVSGLGRVQPDGSWAVIRKLGRIEASPEFSFPLQLVYRSAGRRVGLFGQKWFCPQLETAILPGKKNVLIWSMPNGRAVAFYPKKGSSREFLDGTHEWQLSRQGFKDTIRNNQGWSFLYEKGILRAVESPTEHRLEFTYRNGQLTEVSLQDKRSTAKETLLSCKYRGRFLDKLKTRTASHSFTYAKGTVPLLASWEYSGFPKAETTENNLPGLGLQPDEVFFTGKPYSEEIGGVIFKYRNYDPEINRWTTLDPSGFPDGANNYYMAGTPTRSFDPLGLWYNEHYGPVDAVNDFIAASLAVNSFATMG
ncbi:MAG: RHS repeat-associated core domain-containing protein, partial [Chthoniobacterales bacterium]